MRTELGLFCSYSMIESWDEEFSWCQWAYIIPLHNIILYLRTHLESSIRTKLLPPLSQEGFSMECIDKVSIWAEFEEN